MKRLFLAAGVILIVLFAGVLTAGARDFDHHGFRGGVIIGPGWGPWWGPYSYGYPYAYPYGYGYPYAYPYSYPYGYNEPSVVIERESSEYYQRNDAPRGDGPTEQYYWYYCSKPKGYYPYIKSCPEGWKKVLPTPPSDGKE